MTPTRVYPRGGTLQDRLWYLDSKVGVRRGATVLDEGAEDRWISALQDRLWYLDSKVGVRRGAAVLDEGAEDAAAAVDGDGEPDPGAVRVDCSVHADHLLVPVPK
jgi:hypothetical protein